MEELIGKNVIVRGRNSGVFWGEVVSVSATVVKLKNCRRIWYWDGAATLSEMAINGVKRPENCKIPAATAEHYIFDACEIIPTTTTADRALAGVKIWTA